MSKSTKRRATHGRRPKRRPTNPYRPGHAVILLRVGALGPDVDGFTPLVVLKVHRDTVDLAHLNGGPRTYRNVPFQFLDLHNA